MKLYLRETGDIPTAVIALEILPHVICRKMNELHFIFIVYETFFCFCFWNKKIEFCKLIQAHMMTSMRVIIVNIIMSK